MGCMHCVARVKAALEGLGAKEINVAINSAELEYDGNAEDIRKAIEGLDFGVVSIQSV